MATDVARLNALELEKLHLTADYVTLMLELEAKLESMRLCLSKTKSIVGFSNASANLIDLREMEETTRVCFDKNTFLLESNEESAPKAVNRKQRPEKTEKPTKLKNYKPFGELEPQSAKQTRQISENAILIACELATLQQKIRQLN